MRASSHPLFARCSHAARALFVRCSRVVRALFVRARTHPQTTRRTRLPRATHGAYHTHGHRAQSHSHSHRRRAPAKGRRAARGQRCRLWLKRWPSGSLWWCRSVTYQRSPRTGGCATIWLAPSQPAASESHQAGQRGAGRHLSATWLLSAGIVRHSTTGLACVNRRSTEPTPGSVITVLPPHGAPLLLLAEGRGQRKGGRHRGTARRAAVDASRAPHEVEAGCLFH